MFNEITSHIHPIMVHFPIVLIIVGLGVDLTFAIRKRALAPTQGLWNLDIGCPWCMAFCSDGT